MAFIRLFSVNVKGFQRPSTTFIQQNTGSFTKANKWFHITPLQHFPETELKLPSNVVDINSAEIGRFCPLRQRDYCGPVISAHYVGIQECITPLIDNSSKQDAHIDSYDCKGAVSLSSSMQSNVPDPFSGKNSHLGMPGSQWGQGYKYLSENLHNSHYLSLRNEYRSLHTAVQKSGVHKYLCRRMSSTEDKKPASGLSAKEKLKLAVRDYGSTVIIFHVTISLISLGTCYLLVSSGLDITKVLEFLNIGDGRINKETAMNAGTFVIAYGVHKIFAPARIAITLTATPFIVKHLRRIGYIKTKPVTVNK